jgi:large subunit ribosomal protein L9
MDNIEFILTEKITGLGAEADVVKVRGGFARNFLLPQGRALEATRANLRQTEQLKTRRAAREKEEMKAAEKTAKALKRSVLKLELATGQGGKAFGAITAQDIATATFDQSGVKIDRHDILLEKPIKSTGEFTVEIRITPEVTGELKLSVAAKSDQPGA